MLYFVIFEKKFIIKGKKVIQDFPFNKNKTNVIKTISKENIDAYDNLCYSSEDDFEVIDKPKGIIKGNTKEY